jgi:hypothetical protein
MDIKALSIETIFPQATAAAWSRRSSSSITVFNAGGNTLNHVTTVHIKQFTLKLFNF